LFEYFSFPVEENAAIYAFVARIDDEREIVAELKEKKAAQQEYSSALAQGHGAYLLEQDEASNDIFIISVGAYVFVHQSFV
jgi:poly [ADP-ribose] polymerase